MELCRRHGISEKTYYRWKAQYGGQQVSETKKLKALEEENRRLKKLVADQALNLQVLKEAVGKRLVTAAERRTAVTTAREAAQARGTRLSERQACRCFGRIGRRCATARAGPRMPSCASGCARRPPRSRAGDTGTSAGSSGATGSWSTTSA